MTTDAPQRDAALSGKRRRWSMSVINFWIDATILLFLTALVVNAYALYAQRVKKPRRAIRTPGLTKPALNHPSRVKQ